MFKQRCFRLLLLASAIATSLSAAAYSFESAGIYYNITGNNTVEVTYSDRDNNTYSGSISVPETVTNNGTEYSVTTIGESAFKGSAVTSVSMPESITSIDYDAFYECKNLESVTLPESLTTLDYDAFNSCQSLKTIKIPSGVTAIPGSCFYCCSSLESVTIPEGVMTIGEYAFYFCSNLKSVILPNSLETIEGGLFSDCTNLESVKIPNTVTSIRHSAFQYCCNLESIIIPSSVNSIGISAFSECKALKDVYCQAVNVPETHSSAFNNSPIENMTLYVPGESMNAYKTTAPWSGFGKFQALTTGIEKTETAAKPMITTADGQIAVSGLSGNAIIQVLSLDGKLLDSTNATDGIATLNAQPGEVVIVKVGTESYKVVVR